MPKSNIFNFKPNVENHYCSKEALKVLSLKEKQLKEFWMQIATATHATNKDIVRVSAWFINHFKRKIK